MNILFYGDNLAILREHIPKESAGHSKQHRARRGWGLNNCDWSRGDLGTFPRLGEDNDAKDNLR